MLVRGLLPGGGGPLPFGELSIIYTGWGGRVKRLVEPFQEPSGHLRAQFRSYFREKVSRAIMVELTGEKLRQLDAVSGGRELTVVEWVELRGEVLSQVATKIKGEDAQILASTKPSANLDLSARRFTAPSRLPPSPPRRRP